MNKHDESTETATSETSRLYHSFDSSDTDNDQAVAYSTTMFRRLKRNFKTRSYRRKIFDADDINSSSSNVEDNNSANSSTASLYKLQKRVKRQSYDKTVVDGDDGNLVSADESIEKNDGDSSDTALESDNDQECKDNSDEWTSSDEEPYVTPLVLRKVRPTPTLSIINEIVHRQIGHCEYFERKFYGSLHMVERLKYLHSLDQHKGCVNTVEFISKGDLLVSGSDDLAIIVWKWATGRKCNFYESGHKDNIFQKLGIPPQTSLKIIHISRCCGCSHII